MSRELIPELIDVLRAQVLRGSTREIDPNLALGESGVGLDSLALVEFVTALENHFDLDIPEETWVNRGQLSVASLAEVVADARGAGPAASPAPRVAVHQQENYDQPALERVRAAFRSQGVLGGARWVARTTARKIARTAYHRDYLHVLAFDLQSQPIPSYTSDADPAIAPVAVADLAELDGLFRPGLRDYKAKVFRQRLQDGYLCYGAWIDNRLVALDWVATDSDYESTSRVQLTLSAGACYGLDLNEHPDYKDQGIGLALLSYALDDCRKRGFERQYTIVHGINKTMLLTSTQLFGFKPIGKIWTRKVLGGHRASWEIDGRSGSGAQLTL